MYRKYLLIGLIMLLVFPVMVHADCSEYSASECEANGCTLKDGVCIYNNFNGNNDVISCGNGLIDNVPSGVPKVTHIIYNIIQVAVPVLLVLFGSMDLIKAVVAGKDDEIKKSQSIFIKRLISALIVFFVFIVVKLLVSVVADNNSNNSASNIIKCTECFIEAKCS